MTKKIIIGIVSIIVGYVLYTVITIIVYVHHSNDGAYKNYTWLLKDSVRDQIDPDFSGSYTGRHDVYNYTHYRDFCIKIWAFEDLKDINPENIFINTNVNLPNAEVKSGEVLNSNGNPAIAIKYGFSFDNSLTVNLDESSTITKIINAASYKGFYGVVNRMSFSNEGKDQIIFDYREGKMHALFLACKIHGSFYILMIESEKPFDENMINIFKLE